MKNTLAYLLKSIVDHPEDIKVTEKTVESQTVFTIAANSDDIGKIIGKSGRIIRAIRDLVKLMAAKQGKYADVVLAEESSQYTVHSTQKTETEKV